jgi:hypothetical protein
VLFVARDPRVQPAPGFPCALFIERVKRDEKLGRNAPREYGLVSSTNSIVMPREGGHPVSGGLSIQALPPLKYWIVRLRGQ